MLLGALVVLALAPVARAQAPQPGPGSALGLVLSAQRTGWIAAHVTGPPAAVVTLSESGPAGPEPVGTVTLSPAGSADVARAVPWRCDRGVRRLSAALASDGDASPASAEVRTPSCRARLAVAIRPARPRAGRRTAVEIRDRWRVGDLATRLCLREPGDAQERCRAVRLAAGRGRAVVAVRPRRPGRWRLRVTGPADAGLSRPLTVRPASRRLRVLATGDSMIQVVDGELERGLVARGAVTLRSDAHVSTGITKPFMLDWPAHARATARTWHPDVTVMFLGANDGYPMGTPGGPKAACCDAAWVREYARRARGMMRTYARGGEGMVYWMLLPAPRSPQFGAVFEPVNRALRAAAKAFPGTVHLIDLGATFTPGGRFRQQMRWHGRLVSVRQADGVHLSGAGAAIAADVIIRAMRQDGVIG